MGIFSKITLLSIGTILSLNASEFEFGTTNLKMNYVEVDKQDRFLDSEDGNFQDLYGLTFKYKSEFYKNNYWQISSSFIFGETEYKGKTLSGTPLNFTQEKVRLFESNLLLGIPLFETENFSSDLLTSIGNRNWFRGKGTYEYSYEEIYNWYYASIGMKLSYNFTKDINISLIGELKKSFSGELKTGLGDLDTGKGTDFKLDDVKGYSISIPIEYKINNNYSFITEYKYDYWHIGASDPKLVKFNDNIVRAMYEPESDTKSNYIGFKLKYIY